MTRQAFFWHFAASLAFASAAGAAAAQDVRAGIESWQSGDYEAAVRNWRPLADRGDADAQFNLGHAYRLGRGVPQNLGLAEQWYERAARRGHVQAQAAYGLILFQNNRQRDAMPWIERAAEAGDPRAQYVLGTALFNGDLVAADLPRAWALMSEAAASGLPQAQQQLRLMEPHIDQADRTRATALAAADPAADAVPAVTRPRRVSTTPTVRTDETPPPPQTEPAPPPVPVRTAPPPAPVRSAPPPAVPVRTAPSGRWRVQLGAFSSEANARRHWQQVSGSVAALADLTPRFERAGNLIRLQAAGLPDRAAAERVCAAVQRAGKGCFAVAP